MRLFNSGYQTRSTSLLSFVALGLMAIAALPGKAWSQGGTPPMARRAVVADSLIEACYVPTTGVVYLIKEPGLKAYCAAQHHIYFSWRSSGEAGPSGLAGATGITGATGATGITGATGGHRNRWRNWSRWRDRTAGSDRSCWCNWRRGCEWSNRSDRTAGSDRSRWCNWLRGREWSRWCNWRRRNGKWR